MTPRHQLTSVFLFTSAFFLLTAVHYGLTKPSNHCVSLCLLRAMMLDQGRRIVLSAHWKRPRCGA